MRKFAFVAGALSLIMVSGIQAQARVVKERCTANRCVYYEPGKGRIASAKKDAAGRTVIRTNDGQRIVVKKDRHDGNRLRIRIGEDR